MIFKRVEERRPYPDHDTSLRQWSELPPRQIRLDELVTVKRILDLETLLAEDSTFFGDLFAHVVEWRGELYLEDGLHRALRAALQQRPVIHARVLVLADAPPVPSEAPAADDEQRVDDVRAADQTTAAGTPMGGPSADPAASESPAAP